MLEQLREFGNKRIVRLIFALFLVIPFGLFGIDYYFKSPIGGDTLVNVGPARIGATEFDQALRQQAEVYRQQFRGNFDASLMDNPEVRRAVLDRLVNDRLVAIGAQRAGVRVGDKELARRIADEPFFQVDGKFSRERYEQIAKSQGMSAVGLDERLREDYRQQQFRQAIMETAIVPRATLDSFIRLSEQTREVSVVNVTPESQLAKVTIKPEAVKAYYDAHAAEFTTPEQARVEYIEVSTDTLAAQLPVAKEEIEDLYKRGIESGRFGQKEERKASHILIAVKPDAKDAEKKAAEAKAAEIAGRVRKNPKSFADEAKKESQDPGSAPQGGDLGYFGRGAMVKPFEEAAFSARKGDIVGPVRSDFGYHIIQVTGARGGEKKSFEAVRGEIENEVRSQLVQKRFADAAVEFGDIVYEQPDSLKPAADKWKLDIRTAQHVTRAPSPAASGALANPRFLEALFSPESTRDKKNTKAIDVGANQLAAGRVVQYSPAHLLPFAEVKDRVRQMLAARRAGELATKLGSERLAKLQANPSEPFSGRAVLVSRAQPRDLPRQLLDAALKAPVAKLPAFVGVSLGDQGYAIAKIVKTAGRDPVVADPTKSMAQYAQVWAEAEAQAYYADLKSRFKVSINEAALAHDAAASEPR